MPWLAGRTAGQMRTVRDRQSQCARRDSAVKEAPPSPKPNLPTHTKVAQAAIDF
jgi:hypothetical protein